jgi:hypothetical protein
MEGVKQLDEAPAVRLPGPVPEIAAEAAGVIEPGGDSAAVKTRWTVLGKLPWTAAVGIPVGLALGIGGILGFVGPQVGMVGALLFGAGLLTLAQVALPKMDEAADGDPGEGTVGRSRRAVWARHARRALDLLTKVSWGLVAVALMGYWTRDWSKWALALLCVLAFLEHLRTKDTDLAGQLDDEDEPDQSAASARFRELADPQRPLAADDPVSAAPPQSAIPPEADPRADA